MPLRIKINGRFLTRRATGVERFAHELLRAWWPRFGGAATVSIAMPARPRTAEAGDIGIPVDAAGRTNGHLWEQCELPRRLHGAALVSLCNTAPLPIERQLVVIHDANAVANASTYGFAYRHWHRFITTVLMRRARVVATVSRFSADELSRYFGIRGRGIEVIHEGGEHILREPSDTAILSRLGIGGRPYVLAVGSQSPNKNLRSTVAAMRAIADLGIPLVTAGAGNPRIFAAGEDPDQGVIRAGYVSDGQLRALYEHAECFIFPSFYEGFGLPPLEAMHCGCPVIVSNRASMPEICADAAVYCDPADVADIGSRLRGVLTSANLRSDLRAAGLERARQFSWAGAAVRFDEILRGAFLEEAPA